MKTQPMRRHTVVSMTAFLLLTAFAASRVMAVDPVTDATVEARVAAAKTPADHEAIATYYRAEAAAAEAAVKRHEAMLAKYRTLSSETTRIMQGHCTTLISSYKKVAESFEGLAKEQENLAKGADGK